VNKEKDHSHSLNLKFNPREVHTAARKNAWGQHFQF